jgi:SAM-dependent methyltransferase
MVFDKMHLFWSKDSNDRMQQIDLFKGKVLNQKSIYDEDFDSFYPEKIERLSAVQWTPTVVVQTILDYLKLNESDKVLDVGSGVGKFCILSALYSKASFAGVERRKDLHQIADSLAKEFQIDNVKFIYGDMEKIDWYPYTVLYFYNPFYESLTTKNMIDEKEEKGLVKYTKDLIHVKNRLNQMREGTRVVTYHSFGGKMPSSYLLEKKISLDTGDLEFYTKE